MPTSRATVVTCSANVRSVSVMLLIVSASAAISPFATTTSFLRQVAVRDRGDDLADAAHLVGQVRGHQVDVVGEVLPRARRRRARAPGRRACPSVPTSRATRVTSAANVRSCSTIALMVSFSSRISPFASTVIFLREVAVGDGRGDQRDVAHLRRQVAGEHVHAVGQVLPRARGARHARLAAELAFDADLARHRGHLIGERAQRVGHVVDRVGERRDLAARLERRASARDRRWRPRSRPWRCRAPGWSGSTAMTFTFSVSSCQVPATPGHLGLAAELAFGADLARDARDLARRTCAADRPSR